MSTLDFHLDKIQNRSFRDRMKLFLCYSPVKKLYHIDVYGLAGEWGIKRKELLEEFIHGVFSELFTLTWVSHCPGCGCIVSETAGLYNVSQGDTCPLCELTFINQADRNLEVFFSIHDSVMKIPEGVMEEVLQECYNEINSQGHFLWKSLTTIKGIDCLNSPVFRNLLTSEILPNGISLEVETLTFMFINIRHSTRFFKDQGDRISYKIVSDHFHLIYKIISQNNGLTLKTMGDTVAGVFTREKDALKASLQCQKKIIRLNNKSKKEDQICFQTGIHTGSSTLVTFNNKLDYFGLTINTAHKLQEMAEGNEIVLSQKIYSRNSNDNLLKNYLPGIKKSFTRDNIPIYILNCSG